MTVDPIDERSLQSKQLGSLVARKAKAVREWRVQAANRFSLMVGKKKMKL